MSTFITLEDRYQYNYLPYFIAFLDTTTDNVYILLEDRLEALYKKEEEYVILEKMKGSTLVGRKYRPLFSYFQHLKSDQPGQGAFRIVRLDCMAPRYKHFSVLNR